MCLFLCVSVCSVGETITVFTPDYHLTDKDREEIHKKIKNVHGLKFKSYPDDKSLWIRNDEVIKYLEQLHRLYGGKFGFKGGIIDVETFNKWRIPVEFLDLPKCVQVKGPGCSMYRCLYYKNLLSKNL